MDVIQVNIRTLRISVVSIRIYLHCRMGVEIKFDERFFVICNFLFVCF